MSYIFLRKYPVYVQGLHWQFSSIQLFYVGISVGQCWPGLVKIKLVLLQLHPCLPIFELRNYISFNVYIQRAIRWGLNRIGLESAFIYLPFKSSEMVTKKGNDYKLLEV